MQYYLVGVFIPSSGTESRFIQIRHSFPLPVRLCFNSLDGNNAAHPRFRSVNHTLVHLFAWLCLSHHGPLNLHDTRSYGSEQQRGVLSSHVNRTCPQVLRTMSRLHTPLPSGGNEKPEVTSSWSVFLISLRICFLLIFYRNKNLNIFEKKSWQVLQALMWTGNAASSSWLCKLMGHSSSVGKRTPTPLPGRAACFYCQVRPIGLLVS